MKILIVDDCSEIRSLIANMIRLENAKISQAGNYEDALEMLIGNKFDLIFCDLEMPSGSCMPLINHWKGSRNDAKFVIMSNFEPPEKLHYLQTSASIFKRNLVREVPLVISSLYRQFFQN